LFRRAHFSASFYQNAIQHFAAISQQSRTIPRTFSIIIHRAAARATEKKHK